MMQSQKAKVKRQKSKGKSAIKNYKLLTFNLYLYLLPFYFLLSHNSAFAKEITILYSGDTHAMLYPCSCPVEPDGGIARRATLLKQLKKDYPDALVLDSGSFFAGGLMDEYTQDIELDKQRSMVNLKAMELMQYDAVTLGEDEFNFGREFLQENINKTHLTFLSSNIQSDKVLPYLIKEVRGVKVGIVGVTNPSAAQKAGGLKFSEPKTAVAETVAILRKNGVNIIVLLSHLGGSVDLDLINSIKGIDVLIGGRGVGKEEPFSKIDETLVLRPSWEGRRLGKVSLKVEDNRVIAYKVDELRLSDKIPDDPAILSILPRCFSDNNCKKEGFYGVCKNAGSINASCLFKEADKINLLIITPRDCSICDPTTVVNFLKKQFPGLVVSYLYYPDEKADSLIRDFAISGLPAYLLDKEIEKEKNFNSLKANLDLKGNFYMLKLNVTGVSYFINRQRQNGKIDLFISLFDKNTPGLLDAIEEFNPIVHFLAIETDKGFDAPGGNFEIEEYSRALCVEKYYQKYFWDYISCRTKNKDSSWWENCLGDLDANKIRVCAKGNEGSSLLKENIRLNKELQVMFGPTYLLENQQIFTTQGAPRREDFKKIFKR